MNDKNLKVEKTFSNMFTSHECNRKEKKFKTYCELGWMRIFSRKYMNI